MDDIRYTSALILGPSTYYLSPFHFKKSDEKTHSCKSLPLRVSDLYIMHCYFEMLKDQDQRNDTNGYISVILKNTRSTFAKSLLSFCMFFLVSEFM